MPQEERNSMIVKNLEKLKTPISSRYLCINYIHPKDGSFITELVSEKVVFATVWKAMWGDQRLIEQPALIT